MNTNTIISMNTNTILSMNTNTNFLVQVQQADQFTRSVAGSKLTVIAEQVRLLSQSANPFL